MNIGEPPATSTVSKILSFLTQPNVHLYNLYGPAECTLTTTYHLIENSELHLQSIPIGRPLPGYICQVLDEYLQPVLPRQIGELFIGGQGVFRGYLHRPDLTREVLVKLNDGHIYYRTGDLVRLDSWANGLVYVGRKDFDIKLRGQRIACEEIEHVLLSCTSLYLSRAVVVKYEHLGQETLVAYVQTNEDNKDIPKKLRCYCEECLPMYMVPALIIALKQFPLSANGKLDRKRLPFPDFNKLISVNEVIVEPHTDTEKIVLEVWKEQLNIDRISVDKSFFALGGNSLLLSRSVRRYQTILAHKVRRLPMVDFFKQSTVIQHALLIDKLVLQQSKSIKKQDGQWTSLNITEGPASFAQTRLFIDEPIRFLSNPNLAIYNTPLIMQVKGSISVERLREALNQVVNKQTILRTGFKLDMSTGELRQRISDSSENSYIFENTTVETDQDLATLIDNEKENTSLFDLSLGRVFRCHVIHHQRKHSMTEHKTIVIFNFHHIAIDAESFIIFQRDLKAAYADTTKALEPLPLHYIDFSWYESQFDKSKKWENEIIFWKNLFDKTSSTVFLSNLPYDRMPRSIRRSGRGHSFCINLNDLLSTKLRNMACDLKVTLNHLTLAAFFSFLYKLTQKTDIQIGVPSASRPEYTAMADIIGFFVNILPFRCILDPSQAFVSLVEQVQELSLSILEHSHVPYQRIVEQTYSSPIHISYECVTTQPSNEPIELDEMTTLIPFVQKQYYHFDLSWSTQFSPHDKATRLSLDASADLFNAETVREMVYRFESVLSQFVSFPNNPIFSLSLLLPHENNLLKSSDAIPETDPYSADLIVPQQFACQAAKHPQKVSVALNNQYLSYAELLHASQYLAHHLIDVYHVKRHDIVTQCVNRSIEMIIGIMAIVMTGATYCPLSPDQPVKRLHSLIAQTQSVCTLIHSATKPFELSNYVEIDKVLLSSGQKQVSIEHIACADDIAYAIFTSGSTGTPKCVPITHHDFTTYIRTIKYLNVLTENDTVLQISAVTFDIHLEEVMGTLLLGGQIVLLQNSADHDLNYIISIIKNSQITYIAAIPTMLAELVETLRANECEDARLPTIRYIVLGGK